MNHSGKRPRRSSDDKTEASLALWLDRSLIRRTRAVNNQPCLRQLTTKETAHLNSIVRATVATPQVGNVATSKRLRHKEPEPERTNNLDMKSSQRVVKERCRELGLSVHGDKQVLLARILNEENSLTTDNQVKDSDTDQEMLWTFKGTESLPIRDYRQTEFIAQTPFKRPHTLTPTLNITAGTVGGG